MTLQTPPPQPETGLHILAQGLGTDLANVTSENIVILLKRYPNVVERLLRECPAVLRNVILEPEALVNAMKGIVEGVRSEVGENFRSGRTLFAGELPESWHSISFDIPEGQLLAPCNEGDTDPCWVGIITDAMSSIDDRIIGDGLKIRQRKITVTPADSETVTPEVRRALIEFFNEWRKKDVVITFH